VKDSLYSGIEYVMVTALVFTGGALVYEHRRISKLKVSRGDLKKFIEEQRKNSFFFWFLLLFSNGR